MVYRTLVYVEGEASIRLYEDAEGKKQSALNIVQREQLSHSPPILTDMLMIAMNDRQHRDPQTPLQREIGIR